jgi:hypothetical protein
MIQVCSLGLFKMTCSQPTKPVDVVTGIELYKTSDDTANCCLLLLTTLTSLDEFRGSALQMTTEFPFSWKSYNS